MEHTQGDGGVVERTQGDGRGGAVLGGVAWFRGEGKGVRWRGRERAGVSGSGARCGADNGCQCAALRLGVGQRWPHGSHALSMVGHDSAQGGVLQRSIRSLTT